MADEPLVWIGLGWWSTSTIVHWLSAGLAQWRRPPSAVHNQASDFSVVAPMNGLADAAPGYVRALQALAEAGAEILICVADNDDSAATATRALWPEAPILVGSDRTFNPKMNNVGKGLKAATRQVVALCDAGIAIDADTLCRAAAPLSDKVGLVLALKAAETAENFAAELERAYIDGHQARFLFAADRLGLAVASGGVTLLSRETLQRIGHIKGFNRWIADDYSVTRSVRELGLATRLGDVMTRLPLGRRDWPTVWRRQVRWARTRLRLPVWPLVLWEPAIGWALSGIVGAAALAAVKPSVAVVVLGLAVHTVAWLAGEKWFMAGRGLAFGPRAAAAALVREALAPVLMVRALSGRDIDWRGNDLGDRWRTESASQLERQAGDIIRDEPVWSRMESTPDIATVMLPEYTDSTTAASVEETMLAALRPAGRLIVDGGAVTYMSAAGVRALATVLHRAEQQETRVVLCNFSGAAADCLLVSGFSRLLDIAGSVEEARARLNSGFAGSGVERLHPRRTAG
jgi:ceramide glucosyltransferase